MLAPHGLTEGTTMRWGITFVCVLGMLGCKKAHESPACGDDFVEGAVCDTDRDGNCQNAGGDVRSRELRD